MNKIYKEMYPNKLFTLQEATKIIKNNQICRNNINRLIKQKFITRLKAGLYFINPLDNKEFYPDTIHIASKIRPEAIISANTALRAKGISSSALGSETTLYICSKHTAKLRINKHTFKIIKNFNFGIDKAEYVTPYGTVEIKVTDLERTILDCLRTRSLKGDELINIIKTNIQKIRQIELSTKKMLNYLEKYNMPILYNKAGLFLELCKPYINVDESDLEKIRKKLSKKIFYFKERGIKLIRPRYHYYKEWNIMLPEPLFELTKASKPVTT